MNKIFIKSFSIAMRSKQLLQNNDIYARVEKHTNKTYGCGYLLTFDYKDYDMVKTILRNNNINFSAIER